MAKKWIDAHGHFVAPGTGVNRAPGTQAGEAWVFTPETSIAYMDRTGVAAQIVSNCNPISSNEAIVASNTFGASLVAAHPTRFGFLAQLPMVDPDLAVAEIRRGCDELGAEGFATLTNFGGVYLG